MKFVHIPGMPILNFDAALTPYDPQHFRKEFESPVGQKIYEVATSRDGRLLAAAATYLREPIAALLDPFIAAYVGEQAFSDRMKQYTGHLYKHIAACCGGEIDRKGVDVVIPDAHYTKATRYKVAA